MIVLGAFSWLVILALYGAVWIGVFLVLLRLQRRSGISFLQPGRSVAVFVLRVLAAGMVLFPMLDGFLYVPFEFAIGNFRVCEKPRLIEDMGVAYAVAAALALLASVVGWWMIQHRQLRAARRA